MISIKRKTLGDIIMDVVVYVILTILAILMVIPFIYVVAASFSDEVFMAKTPMFLLPMKFTGSGVENHFSAAAYETVFTGTTSKQVIRSLFVSIGITVIGTMINLFFTATMAYGLSRKTLIGKKFMLNIVLFTMVFGGGMIPTFLLVRNLGMYDTYASLIIPGAISAYNMLIVRNFFIELPQGLEEAASIDGCTDIGIFVKIALPLSLPCLATFGLFYAVGHWNGYMTALLYLNDAKKYPFQLVLRNIITQTAQDQIEGQELPEETLKMAVIVIGTVPILCVYPFLQKHFAAGVMVGAIKG
ncbi:MAG: carbohydrate ABC transporter permease [Oscillospiraceae bacterium]|nr:carbohydrate ABC transporter permease [Oscillospiraceae bacterium]